MGLLLEGMEMDGELGGMVRYSWEVCISNGLSI